MFSASISSYDLFMFESIQLKKSNCHKKLQPYGTP
jgi:hypothetical protein